MCDRIKNSLNHLPFLKERENSCNLICHENLVSVTGKINLMNYLMGVLFSAKAYFEKCEKL